MINKSLIRGFTLLELLLATTVISLLVLTSSISYKRLYENINLVGIKNEIMAVNNEMIGFFYENNRSYKGVCNHVAKEKNGINFSCSSDDESYTITASRKGFTLGVNSQEEYWTDAAPKGWRVEGYCWVNDRNGC